MLQLLAELFYRKGHILYQKNNTRTNESHWAGSHSKAIERTHVQVTVLHTFIILFSSDRERIKSSPVAVLPQSPKSHCNCITRMTSESHGTLKL
jgi:hypothetical protein